jgi:uncharacterized protein YbjT (DUF2867 family)
MLVKGGKAVRAMVRNEDERAQALRDLGAEVVIGDLLGVDSMHSVIAGYSLASLSTVGELYVEVIDTKIVYDHFRT